MRHMSFAMTTEQVEKGTKTVTRRDGWTHLKPGEIFLAVRKTMGLKRGQKVQPIRHLRCISNSRERLDAITKEDVVKEGYPDLTPKEFIAKYIQAKRGRKATMMVSRIEFDYVIPFTD